ncbi:hypothetical protein EDD15DRAFT_2583315 [Pisolithus albus]|nr:hypothetical protein EDD15DRAFT_2583315 [Pisolithus albus]
MLDEYQHNDFEVVRKDTRFGGFEGLKLRKQDATVSSFSPLSRLDLEKLVMKDGCSGALYPMYTHDGHRWVLIQVAMSSDIKFTYDSGGGPVTQTLLWDDRKGSNEGIGVWHVGNDAWKLYSRNGKDKEKKCQKLVEDYRRADGQSLPMGKPRFQNGRITRADGTWYNGMVLIVTWFEGTNFHLRRRRDQSQLFDSALERQEISHSRSDEDYVRIKAGCERAKAVGLQDCQGYVKRRWSEPIVFIDVHTSWNAQQKKFGHSEKANEMVDIITEWGREP